MKVFDKIPYYIPFTFASVSDDVRLERTQPVPYNVAIYGITMKASVSPYFGFYHSNIQFIDYTTGDTLFDEPLQNLCLQSDARTYWKLPSKWFVKKNTKIICTLDSFNDVITRTFYITLLAHVVDADPNPGIQPFAYSFPISVGFQDNFASGGGTTSVPLGQGLTGTLAKHMLHDFDIHAIVLDPFGGDPVSSGTAIQAIPAMSFQLSTQKKKFFDRIIINGCAGGGSIFSQGNLTVINDLSHAFPTDAILQYKLPQVERICKGELVRVDIAPAPTYLPTLSIHQLLNQRTCMALIGNHIA